MNTTMPSHCDSPPEVRGAPWSVLIVDDELPAIANLEWLLAQRPEWRLLPCCRSAHEARDQLAATPADLVLLDIQMPGQSGLAFARELCSKAGAPLIVFVTAYDEHALDAFDVFALDYLLKPFDDERFDRMLQRAAATLALNQQAAMHSATLAYLQDRDASTAGTLAAPLQQLVVRTSAGLERIALDDILWIGSAGNYVELHLAGRVVLHRATLSALAARLPLEVFVRVHRTALVHRDAILSLGGDSDSGYALRLKQGAAIRISGSYLKQVQALFA